MRANIVSNHSDSVPWQVFILQTPYNSFLWYSTFNSQMQWGVYSVREHLSVWTSTCWVTSTNPRVDPSLRACCKTRLSTHNRKFSFSFFRKDLGFIRNFCNLMNLILNNPFDCLSSSVNSDNTIRKAFFVGDFDLSKLLSIPSRYVSKTTLCLCELSPLVNLKAQTRWPWTLFHLEWSPLSVAWLRLFSIFSLVKVCLNNGGDKPCDH